MYANELCHHGIKGQRWGERNGPPYPLKPSRHSISEKNSEYKQSIAKSRAIKASKTKKDVDSIINSMNKKDRYAVLAGSSEYLNLDEGEHVVKRFVKNYGKIPVSFFDLLQEDDVNLQVALGTRSGKEYRGKGYASDVAKQAIDYLKKNRNKFSYRTVTWGVLVSNRASIKIAQNNGFVLDPNSYSDDGKWVNYVLKL